MTKSLQRSNFFLAASLLILTEFVGLSVQALTPSCSPALAKLSASASSNYLPANPNFKNLCELSQRYQQLKSDLKNQGIEASRIPEIRGPRFINPTDWARSKESHQYDPTEVYPKRKTLNDEMKSEYQAWDVTANRLDQSAEPNFKAGAIKDLDFAWLVQINKDTTGEFSPFSGNIRFFSEFGRANTPGLENTLADTVAINAIEYRALGTRNTGVPLLKFKYTKCYHAWSPEKKEMLKDPNARISGYEPGDELDPMTYPNIEDITVVKNGIRFYCGVFQYPIPWKADRSLGLPLDLEVVNLTEEVQSYVNNMNRITKAWQFGSSSPGPVVDPLLAASRAQRWLVTIHPFGMGNGRTSRFVMDYLLLSLGLPTPILTDHNKDLTVSEAEWAREIGKGLLRSISAMEMCAQNPSAKGCR